MPAAFSWGMLFAGRIAPGSPPPASGGAADLTPTCANAPDSVQTDAQCGYDRTAMSAFEWLSILSAAGHLALALLVLLRRTQSPMTLPIALLALTQFGWNFAAFAYAHSGAIVWSSLDRGLS